MIVPIVRIPQGYHNDTGVVFPGAADEATAGFLGKSGFDAVADGTQG